MSFTLGRILGWLREGYPQGVPREDYIALFGVLNRHLTEDEIVQVAERIREANGDAQIGDDEIRRRIENHLKGHAAADDVRRVAARLAAGGWPLADNPANATPIDDAPDASPVGDPAADAPAEVAIGGTSSTG